MPLTQDDREKRIKGLLNHLDKLAKQWTAAKLANDELEMKRLEHECIREQREIKRLESDS